MTKKKASATRKSSSKPSRQPVKKSTKRATPGSKRPTRPSEKQQPAAQMFVYRHEVDGNPGNAPLIVDILIAAGRGGHPSRPTFVGFTAEMAEEHWPDQFAFRIVALEAASVRVMISRVDKGSAELSWGAKLVVHVLVIANASR
jgi:hypothetical protein